MLFSSDPKSLYEEIEYICKLAVGTLKMPVYFLDSEGNIVYEYSYGYSNNPLVIDKREMLKSLFDDVFHENIPIIRSTKYSENFFAIRVEDDLNTIGTFIAGPSIYFDIASENIHQLIAENNISWGFAGEIISHYNSLQVIDYEKLIDSSMLFYYIIYNKKLDKNEVIEKNSSPSDITGIVDKKYKSTISRNRQNISFHHSQIREKYLVKSIIDGDKEKLKKQLQAPMDGETGVLSHRSPLRNEKNLSICSVVIATRAAIEGGLDSEMAYTLSDSYIQQIEETNEINDLRNLSNKMFLDFTQRVYDLKQQNFSKAINKSKNYILNHLYEDISLNELAKDVLLNPNYLCSLFKKEVGITINDFIQKERIEEGKRLLESTSYSILDISMWLNFHDQSHFTKVFKKITGVTPKVYKDKLNVIKN